MVRLGPLRSVDGETETGFHLSATGKTVTFVELTDEQYLEAVAARGRPAHVARETLDMFRSADEFGCE